MSIRWSKEQEEELIVLLANGYTLEQLSQHFSKTGANVRTKIKVLLDAMIKVDSIADIEEKTGLTPDIIGQFTTIPNQEIYAYKDMAERNVTADLAAIKAQLTAAIEAINALDAKLNN